jgi:hypothetical protein
MNYLQATCVLLVEFARLCQQSFLVLVLLTGRWPISEQMALNAMQFNVMECVKDEILNGVIKSSCDFNPTTKPDKMTKNEKRQ